MLFFLFCFALFFIYLFFVLFGFVLVFVLFFFNYIGEEAKSPSCFNNFVLELSL